MKINTTPGETYIVLSTGGCTVTTGAGKQIKKLAAGQDFFTAMTGDSILSDDNASVAVAKGEILSLLNTDSTGEDVQATLRFQPVTSQSALPATGENGVIYLVPNGKTAPNQYTEWVWTGAAYEQLGDGSVDLSGYVSKADLAGDNGEFMVGKNIRVGTGIISLDCPLELGYAGELRFGDGIEGIRVYTTARGIATLHIGSQAEVVGLPNSGVGSGGSGDGSGIVTLAERVLTPKYFNSQVYIGPGSPESMSDDYPRIKSYQDVNNLWDNYVEIVGSRLEVRGGDLAVDGAGATISITNMAELHLSAGSTIRGDGWDTIVADIQAGAAAAAAAEADQESFTKLIFPPTGTATAEQDPSWITKKNILMETSGGQLNMTHLTETLAYAAQNRFDIAKRTLWLSTSPGTGDAVQWPANAVFPDDQPQDKIQQLNSNSTYWFDITYVGGSDTVLIRKVCSWASTTGENGPTD